MQKKKNGSKATHPVESKVQKLIDDRRFLCLGFSKRVKRYTTNCSSHGPKFISKTFFRKNLLRARKIFVPKTLGD